jgi:hypothetical protein
MESLTNGLELVYPVQAYANLEQVSIQGTPSVFLIPEDCTMLQVIPDVRKIKSFRMKQEWLILTVLRDAGDQKVTEPLITALGVFQAKILNILMTDVLLTGGPLQLIDCPKAESIEGGAIAGKIRIATQFVFNAE